MDKAYEGEGMGYLPAVPSKSNRKEPWEYDKELYKCRNVVERLSRIASKSCQFLYIGFIYQDLC
jgi:hypothetical protein